MTAPVRVLKREHISARSPADIQIAELRRSIDEEVASTVAARVAVTESALRAGQQAAHTAALQRAAHSLEAAADLLPKQLADAMDRIADELVDVAAVLVEWLCSEQGAAASSWTGTLSDRIVAALAQLTDQETACLRLSPVDATALADAANPALTNLDIRSDPSLAPGDALITTASGDVDLTLRTALRRAVDVITGRAAAALTDHRDLT